VADSPRKSKKAKPQRKAFLLRLSPDLMERLRKLAARDLRSLNAEIEFLLRQAAGQEEKND